jgi:hypothetical protein
MKEATLFPGGSMVGWKEDHDISDVLVGIFSLVKPPVIQP